MTTVYDELEEAEEAYLELDREVGNALYRRWVAEERMDTARAAVAEFERTAGDDL